ncbi:MULTISPECIES: hypothetical protein [Mycobacteriaceae]|uniref:hypothetical protein n=1 Tax=Mycobacteriaceae TaxID=1762 RepID=UPI000993080E|nr:MULTISPECIES: hypothetical protein [Mycobacteriaceae]MDO3058509.1 hypothetical protein [Mycobacteroides abscessus subsp. abscessus]MDO3277955.1 hypothetical protein [Mycobacteroides abscessus subsp. abscessus]
MTNAIRRHVFCVVALVALLGALFAEFSREYTVFAILAALFLVGVLLDLQVHRRGRYRDRSAVLMVIAFVAIVVAGIFSAPAAYAAPITHHQNGIHE